MLSIYHENTITGATHAVTEAVTAAKWTTKRGGPAALELTVLSDPVVQWECGSLLALRDGDAGLFYGYIFKVERKEGDLIDITAYDQLRYLKNKGTYVFAAKRADEIVKEIADDFLLQTGALVNTGYVIPSLIGDAKSLLDIIGDALDHTLVNAGKLYYLWDDFGALRLSDVDEEPLPLVLGDSSLVSGFRSVADIDSETYNRIILAQDQPGGRVEFGPFQDDTTARIWGTLQEYRTVGEGLNEGQIQQMGEQMLYLYNRPKRSFDLTALSHLSVRSGRRLRVRIEELAVDFHYLVEEASHDLIKQTMSVKLKVV